MSAIYEAIILSEKLTKEKQKNGRLKKKLAKAQKELAIANRVIDGLWAEMDYNCLTLTPKQTYYDQAVEELGYDK